MNTTSKKSVHTLPVIFPQDTDDSVTAGVSAGAESQTRDGFDSLSGDRLSRRDSGSGDNNRRDSQRRDSHDARNNGVRQLPTDRLAESLCDIRASLDEVFSSIQEVGHFKLTEIQLTLELTAEGGFALIGLAKAGAKGGVTLSFAPRHESDSD
ncbi:MAG: hypothetical protein P8176_15590 [Gammaproteobacteria bacterium]